MFEIMFGLFFCVFFFTVGFILYTIIRSAKQERKNDQLPRLSVEAKVIGKRTDFRHGTSVNNHTGHSYTRYYVTFEVRSGDRLELQVQGHEYGMLVEGDFGELFFQGTRYLNFQRRAKAYDL